MGAKAFKGKFQRSLPKAYKPAGQISWTGKYAGYRWWAKKLKRSFKISLEDFIYICSQPCAYCGAPPKRYNHYDAQPRNRGRVALKTRRRATIMCHGLDRINNSKGYVASNLNPCCIECNWAKSNQSHAQFILWINRIRNFWNNNLGST